MRDYDDFPPHEREFNDKELTIPILKQYLKDNNVKGYSRKKKSELIKMILNVKFD